MARHSCSILFYTESSAWVQPGFLNVTAIKQPFFLCLNMVVTMVFLRPWKVQIFKHTEHAHQQLKAEEEVEHHCLCFPLLHNWHFSFAFLFSLLSFTAIFSPYLLCPSCQAVGAKSKSRFLEVTVGCCEVSANAGISLNTWNSLELQGR